MKRKTQNHYDVFLSLSRWILIRARFVVPILATIHYFSPVFDFSSFFLLGSGCRSKSSNRVYACTLKKTSATESTRIQNVQPQNSGKNMIWNLITVFRIQNYSWLCIFFLQLCFLFWVASIKSKESRAYWATRKKTITFRHTIFSRHQPHYPILMLCFKQFDEKSDRFVSNWFIN